MTTIMQGCEIVIFFGLFCCLQAADNRLRIAFNDNSATQGRLEIFHGSAWGAVCDDGFDMNEAQTACLQLGYDVADSFVKAVHSGPLTYLLDQVRCYPNHARLQDCVHNPWGVHNCISNEGIEVICSGGSREIVANIHLNAAFYWNCDEFATGVSYAIKSSHSAVIYGGATFDRSPIDSGFNLRGQSAWVNLGDFSGQPCLVDPYNCSIHVSVWLRMKRTSHHKTYIVGNSYAKNPSFYGFHVRMEGHRLRGEIRGSLRGCYFWDYHIPTYTWFHFSMGWSVGAGNFGTYLNGGKQNRKKCFNPSNATQHNHIYTLGADESLAGNANRDLDVSYDDLVISYATIPQHHQVSPAAIARDFKGYAVTTVTLKVSNLPWNAAYSDPTNPAYAQLVNEIGTLINKSYEGDDNGFTSLSVANVQDNSGELQLSLTLNFTKMHFANGFRLYRLVREGKFLNKTSEIIGCESVHQSCYDIIVDNAASTNEPSDLVVWFHPVAEHLEDAYYNGYQAIAYKINGTRSEYWRGHLRPSSTNRQHIRVKCVPNILVAVCVQLHTLKGNGFSCKNFTTVFLPEGAPFQGPSNVRVVELSSFNVTVAWDNITWGQNGVIQKYRIQIDYKNNEYLDSICCVRVNESQVATFALHPANRYCVYVCGYTSYYKCGAWSSTGWFESPALLPAGAPRDVEVKEIFVKSVKLYWKIVRPNLQYGEQRRYLVMLEKLRTEDIRRFEYPVSDQSKVEYHKWLPELTGLTEYELNISLINVVGEGPIATLTFTTKEGVPSASPQNINIVNVSSHAVSMTWEVIDREEAHGILRGYRLFYRLARLNGTWSNVSVTELIGDVPVLSLRSYEIRMCGYTAVGNGVFSPTYIVNTTGFAPTNVSTDVSVSNATNDTLSVQWSYQTVQDRPAQYFIVTATRNDTNITEATQRLDVLFWTDDVFRITLTGLKEFKWYIVRVAAGNLMGLARYSDMLVLNQTLEGVPSAAPRNLTAANASSRSILLEWKPVLYEYVDGIIRGHRVFWRLADIPGAGNPEQWQEMDVNGTHNTSVEIKNLEKFRDYEFKILAFTSVGESVTTETVIARTDEDIPLHPPLNVQTYNTSSRSLRVTWDLVPAEWRFGIVLGYHVIITDTRDGQEYLNDVKANANRSLERAGFERYTNYTVKVAAYTIKGTGNFSEAIRVLTDEDVPSEGPPGIQCNYINSSSLRIEWSVLPVVKAHGIVRTYVIFLERSDGRYIELYNDTQPFSILNTSFYGLDEYVEYSVQILATTIKGEGVKSDPLTCVTDEDVPHDSPRGIYGFNTSDTTIRVFWQEVPIDDRNGIITEYTIFYNTTLRNGQNILLEKRVRSNVMQTELRNLWPFKYYDVQVAAWTSKGMGPKCNVTTILTEEEPPKVPPSNVQAFNTSSTSIRLKWRPIHPHLVGGILRGYKIFWEEVNYLGEVILVNETRLDNASYEFLDFTGLTKFQEYRFSILAFTKFDGVVSPVISTMSDEDIPTLPPTICSGFNVSKNEIQVLWGDVPRTDRNGIILGYNIYTTEVFNYFATMPPDYEVPHTSAVVNTTDESARAFLQHNLVPYTDYSFQVDAFTSKGNGPNCTAFIVRTEEEAPLFSPGNMSLRNTSSTSIEVTWQGLDQHIIRGIFLGYEIWFTAHPEFPSAYLRYGTEAKRKRRAAFTLVKQITTADIQDESIEITGLAKYTNYTVQVVGYTKFLGAQSEIYRVLTEEDIPSKPPQELGGQNTSSTSIFVRWRPVEDGFVHGILLGYRLYYRLTVLPAMPPFNKTLGPDQLATTIDGLFMFTNYTFQITAFTSKGEGLLSAGVIITTDEDVASKSPFGFKVVNLYHMHEIPMTWNPVPDGFLNGILIGYRIKMWMISDAMLDVRGVEQHIDVGPDTLSYTVRKLPNFVTYRFQIVALTRYGEGVHSAIRTAKTCPCEKYLTTNWYMLPPYTNRTGDQETGILPWLLNHLVRECCADCSNGHGWSEVMYKTDGYGADGYKDRIADFTSTVNENTDFSFPVQGHSLQEKFASFYAYVYAIGSPGVAFFIVDDPPDAMPNAIFDTVNGSYGMLLITLIFSFMAGIVMWVLDAGKNEMEFPRKFWRGSWEGFWWAFISMTTVGYGDRSPRSFLARIFSVVWILAGLVLTSILMGSITNALTTVTFSVRSIKLYGMKVAAIEGSPSYRVGIRRNAKVNPDREYYDAYELQRDLRERKVKGALLDGYMAGSYNELFEEKHIRVKEVIDFNNGYGIVLGGIHHRLQRCFKNWVKRKRSFIVDYVATQIKVVKKNPQSPEEEKSTNLFNPKADIFVKSMTFTLALYVTAILVGFCLQFHFRKRFRRKIRDSTEVTYKSIPKHTSEMLETFCSRISAIKKELYLKHTNELRAVCGLKRRKVEYDVLRQVKEDLENAEKLSKTSLRGTMSTIVEDVDKNAMHFDDEKAFDDIMGFENFEENDSPTHFTEDRFNESVSSRTNLVAPERPQVDPKPDIEDLQREAYLAGLKSGEKSDESGHPFAKMYRYLWVEK